jgi:hypothetical protein
MTADGAAAENIGIAEDADTAAEGNDAVASS